MKLSRNPSAVSTVHQTCWGVKLLPGGQRDLCRGPCPQCAVCHPWVGPIRLLCRSANREQHACNSGQGRHPWRTGPCLCMLHKKSNTQHGAPTPSLTPTEQPPSHRPHPDRPVPLRWLLLFQLIRSMHGGTMGVLCTRNLECV